MIGVALWNSGCATQVKTSVTSFHQLTLSGDGKTFKFVPNAVQKDSIEYQSYAQRIAQKLIAYGWRPSDNTQKADCEVSFNYGIDNGTVVSGSMPVYGQVGGGTAYTSGTVMSGSGGVASYSGTTYSAPVYAQTGTRAYSVTVYNRYLTLEIVSANAEGKPARLYEGRAVSKGRTSEIAQVLPTMIEALFKRFPGNSGKTDEIQLPLVE